MFTELGHQERRVTGVWASAGRKLSRALLERDQGGFLRFATLPSNVKGVEAAMLFSAGLAPFVALVGPSGWGKTHLLEAVAGTVPTEGGEAVRVHAAAEWLANGHRPETRVLVLDDVTDVLSGPRVRQQLRIVLERRVRARRPSILALTSTSVTRAIRGLLPCVREWTIGQIVPPSLAERETVVRHVASTNGLAMSETIVRLIAARASGDGRSINGAIQRLKLVSSRWAGADHVLRACGILRPYLSDASGWDLRDHVSEVVRASAGTHARTAQRSERLGVYVMLHGMGLSEDEVARYYRLQPGEAYTVAMEFAKDCANPDVRGVYSLCVESLVQSFESLDA
jgi:energy-coupling factor transporter ATP-binding protein EcfA2